MAPKKNTTTSAALAASASALLAAASVVPTTVPVAEGAPPVETATTTDEVVVVADAAAAPATSGASERLTAATEKLVAALSSLKELAGALKDVVAIVKVVQKDVIQLQKQTGRKTRAQANKAAAAAAAAEGGAPPAVRRPSGFATPATLSTELCEFLNVPDSTMMARTDVTRLLTQYVKDNKLYGETDKRNIIADAKLMKLLGATDNDKLTYFNLQTYIKHHFLKPTPAVSAAPAIVPEAAAIAV